MADDLDQLIRAAMKTLDDQVPSGYFETLPNQTIARLEGSMQHGSSGTTDTRNQVVAPPVTAMEQETAAHAAEPAQRQEEDREDSGLHDIRNLAQSTKQRLSSKRTTVNPPISDDDFLASSSGSFKNIALPQPARMVSLPEIDELPTKAEVDAAAEKASKKVAKESKAKIAAVAAPAAAVETPAAPAATVAPRKAFSLPSQQGRKSKAPLIAIVGTGLAAAAGYVVFLQVNKAEDKAQAVATAATTEQAAAGSAAPAAAPVVEPIPAPAPPPAEVPAEPAKVEAAAAPVAEIAADDGADKNADAKAKKATKRGKKADDAEKDVVEQKPEKVDVKKPAPAAKGGGGEEGEPSFDALLKEAGVADKKEAKPKLDKKSLTGDDFKKGMAGVTGKAKGCYTGTQGTAMVKLTVAPSGQVSKVSVGGEFAGKPEASCVESAIKAATFPPWDGGPQSFTYSVLLSD